MFGLAVVPLVTAVGAAVDYSRASAARDKLSIIADGAALEAISKAALQSRRGLPDYGKAATEALFRAQAESVPDVTLGTVNVVINQTNVTRDITINYTAGVRNYFGSFLMGNTSTVSGQAVASTSMPVFMDFYLMLDNSPSMGLGATLADIKTLENATAFHATHPNCAFACHEANNANDHYAIARQNNVTLRIDVVRQATQKLIDKAVATEIVPDQFRVSIYTFNMAAQTIAPLTADLEAAKRAAENINLVELPYASHNNYRYTNFSGLGPYINYMPASGNGHTSSSPQTVLFLVSDGVADEATVPRVKPVPVALCDQIKSKGIKIAALYTTYYPIPSNHAYQSEVAPIASQIAPAMQQCASPGYYFEVSPSQGVAEAMQALFQKAVGEARLAR